MPATSLRGSCLCGAVSYEAEGEITRFVHCHCQRCRKATGTGHATNLFLQLTKFDWLSGETQMQWFKPPEAARFATHFCTSCGSLMPRLAPDGSFAIIPAGSLDAEPGTLPTARIFIGSRADWSCDDRHLELHDEYPPP